MAIKSGSIIHVGNDVVLLDRLQTAGPGSVTIRRETIYELGNYKSVGTVSDIPDLSFSMESFDVSCEVEAFLLRQPVLTTHSYNLAASKVVNIKSAFKGGETAAAPFDTVASAAIPGLRLEQASYRFGVGNQNAQQSFTLRGDSLYYNPGSTYIQEVAGSGVANQAIALTNDAYAVTEAGETRRTLAVTAGDKRLSYGIDYTETVGTPAAGAASVTVTVLDAVPVTDIIAVVYASPVVEAFPQSVHALVSGVSDTLNGAVIAGASTFTVAGATTFTANQQVAVESEIVIVSSQAGAVVTIVGTFVDAHPDGAAVALSSPTVKPAAVRGRDIDIYIGPAFPEGTGWAAALGTKRPGAQSADVEWRVQLQQDEEMGNHHFVDVDFDVPQVTGNVSFRPRDVGALATLARDLSGNADPLKSSSVAGAPPMDVQVVIKHPETGGILKRFRIPDARFTVPGYSARVQQRQDLAAPFTSDSGTLEIYDA